jgi:hypothetical protein
MERAGRLGEMMLATSSLGCDVLPTNLKRLCPVSLYLISFDYFCRPIIVTSISSPVPVYWPLLLDG